MVAVTHTPLSHPHSTLPICVARLQPTASCACARAIRRIGLGCCHMSSVASLASRGWTGGDGVQVVALANWPRCRLELAPVGFWQRRWLPPLGPAASRAAARGAFSSRPCSSAFLQRAGDLDRLEAARDGHALLAVRRAREDGLVVIVVWLIDISTMWSHWSHTNTPASKKESASFFKVWWVGVWSVMP